MRPYILWILLLVPLLAGLAALYLFGLRPGMTETLGGPEPTPAAARQGPADAVIILGTSLTARGNWVATLEERLRACNPAVTVRPVARPGANSDWGLAALGDLPPETPADVIVIEFSGNDASLWRGMPLYRSARNHEALIAQARARGAQVLLATMSPAWGLKALARPGQIAYREAYRGLSRSHQTGLIDTTAAWLALSDAVRKAWLPDGLHPTDEAMRTITVPAFEQALAPLVCTP